MKTSSTCARLRTVALSATVVALSGATALLGGTTSAFADSTAPPFNQGGIETSFQVGCFFTTDQNGNPLHAYDGDDDYDGHAADLSDPDDVSYLMTHVPGFFQSSMDALGATDYPFSVGVDVALGTDPTTPLPENPLPGNTYVGPFASDLQLVLPETVSHVIVDNGLDSLVGTVTASASLEYGTGYGSTSTPIASDPFSLGSGADPIVPITEVSEIELHTTGLWRDIIVPADWASNSADILFSGTNAVSVNVEVFDRTDPGQSDYQLNLACFPNGSGGTTNTPVTVGQLLGNYVGMAPSITSGEPSDGVVGSAYTHQLTADGSETIAYSVSAGELPAGLSLDPMTGELTGAPQTAGSYTFTVTATNAYGSDSARYTLVIAADEVEKPEEEPQTGKPSDQVTAKASDQAVATGSLSVTGDGPAIAAIVLGSIATLGGTGMLLARRFLMQA